MVKLDNEPLTSMTIPNGDVDQAKFDRSRPSTFGPCKNASSGNCQ